MGLICFFKPKEQGPVQSLVFSSHTEHVSVYLLITNVMNGILMSRHLIVYVFYTEANVILSPPCRRWFSIQNSQLVYQKKLKVQFDFRKFLTTCVYFITKIKLLQINVNDILTEKDGAVQWLILSCQIWGS